MLILCTHFSPFSSCEYKISRKIVHVNEHTINCTHLCCFMLPRKICIVIYLSVGSSMARCNVSQHCTGTSMIISSASLNPAITKVQIMLWKLMSSVLWWTGKDQLSIFCIHQATHMFRGSHTLLPSHQHCLDATHLLSTPVSCPCISCLPTKKEWAQL